MAEVDVREDGWRDALAFLSAAAAEDCEGVGAVLVNCDPCMVFAALAGMLFDQLRRFGDDPAEWIRQEQERLLEP